MVFDYESIAPVSQEDGYLPTTRETAVLPDRAAAPRFQRGEDGWPSFGTKDTGRATIMITGNLMCQDRVIEAKKTEGPEEDYEFDSCFSRLGPLLAGSDLTIGNLETVIHPEAPYANERQFLNDSSNFNAPPQFLAALRNAGFDLLTTANNHCLDTGLRGLARTFGYLESFGFLHTGSYLDSESPRFAQVKVNGIRIGVVACSLMFDNYPQEQMENGRDWTVGFYNANQIWRDIKAARAAGAEFVLCCVHWGPEDGKEITRVQNQIAQELANLGANYVVGTHPQTVQSYAVRKARSGRRVPVAFSLGSLLCQDQPERQRSSMILRLELERNEKGRIMVRDSYIPCLTCLSYRKTSYVVLPMTERAYMAEDMTAAARTVSAFVANSVGTKLPAALPQLPASSKEEPAPIWDSDLMQEEINFQQEFLSYARLSEDFRKLYTDFMLDVMPDSGVVRHAINRCRTFIKDPEADLTTHRKLIGDVVYCRNVLGFYPYEYFIYGFANKPLEERLEFMQETMCMKYYSKLNLNRKSMDTLNDKFASYNCFRDYYKREAILIRGEESREEFLDYCRRHRDFIIKPLGGSRGAGIRVIRQTPLTNRDRQFNKLLAEFENKGRSYFLCEELIEQHPAMAQIHPQSVNTVRIFSYYNGEEVKAVVAWLKAGQGSAAVDNCGAGGMVAAVDCETGLVTSNAGDEEGNLFVTQPNTGFVFKGFQIPQWEEAIAMVKEIAPRLPGIRLIGWDVALSRDKGWQVVEGNAHGMFFTYQVATQKGMRTEFERAIEWERWRFETEAAPAKAKKA